MSESQESPASAEVLTAEQVASLTAPRESGEPVVTETSEEIERRDQEKAKAKENQAFAEIRRQARENRETAERERQARVRAEQDRDQLMQRLLGNQSQAQASADQKPDPAKFASGEFDPQYIEALTEYKANQVYKRLEDTRAREQREYQNRQYAEKALAQWNESRARAESKFSDFEVVVEAAGHAIPVAAQQVLVGLQDGAELLYQLAKDPGKARALSGNRDEVAAALGELRAEYRIAAKHAEETLAEERSNQRPINGGNGGGRSSAMPDPSNVPAYVKWRRAKLRNG